MYAQYLIQPEAPQVPPYDAEQMAQGLAEQLAVFLFPLLVRLDRLLDKRLVRTFLQTIQVILAYRDRIGGLLLSELGGYLLSPAKAPAGTKRLSTLVHSPKWTAKIVEDELWQRADHQVQNWQEQGEDALAIWDSSEWEKPESVASEDLCAVRSSKAKRRLLQSTQSPHLRAGNALAGRHRGGSLSSAWPSPARRDALVE